MESTEAAPTPAPTETQMARLYQCPRCRVYHLHRYAPELRNRHCAHLGFDFEMVGGVRAGYVDGLLPLLDDAPESTEDQP